MERGNRIIRNIRYVIKYSKIEANCYFIFFTRTRTERPKSYPEESLASKNCKTQQNEILALEFCNRLCEFHSELVFCLRIYIHLYHERVYKCSFFLSQNLTLSCFLSGQHHTCGSKILHNCEYCSFTLRC